MQKSRSKCSNSRENLIQTIKNRSKTKTPRFFHQNLCAAYLCYYLFSKIQKIEKLNWLLACATIADWTYFNTIDFMTFVLEKYNYSFEIKQGSIRRSGKFWDLQWSLVLALIYYKDNLSEVYNKIGENFGEIGDLTKGAQQIQRGIELALEKFEREKEEINGRYFWTYTFKFQMESLVSSLVSAKHFNKTIIIANPEEKYYRISARRQEKKESMAALLQELLKNFKNAEAGGHISAAGGHFLKKDLIKFKEQLKSI